MARPTKSGLDYFPLDTDADQDDKVQAMIYLYGNDGWSFYSRLLMRIYKTPDGELDISDAETRKILARNMGFRQQKFDKMLETSLKKNLFNSELFRVSGRLSSNGVKKRFSAVIERREEMKARYALKRGVSDAETQQKLSRNSAETPQSKVKESKVKYISPISPFEKTNEKEAGEVFSLYESKIGMLTPHSSEAIKLWLSEHSPEHVKEAISEAVKAGVRRQNYINAILENWKVNGYKSNKRGLTNKTRGNGNSTGDELDAEEERLGIKHG